MSTNSVDLPPPDTPVTQVNKPSGISALMFFKLLPRAPTILSVRAGFLGRRSGIGTTSSPGEIFAGPGIRRGHQIVDAALRHDMAAMNAGAGADVEHPVGGADGVLVVFDHDHGVAEVAQAFQRFQEPRIVALVQPDRGLVEHVEHAGEA